ncbi:MAG: hypothetical protein QXW01_02145 [Candidatus Aenigmatarchaeota archaeon]
MKAISAFVATILLVGFTVAVGAIISTWFLTYTRTTTAGVGSATACAAGTLDVTVPFINSTTGNITTILIRNRGTTNVTVTTLSVSCGAVTNTTSTNLLLVPGNQTLQTIILQSTQTPCSSDYTNINVLVSGNCVGGGTISGGCSGIGCRL